MDNEMTPLRPYLLRSLYEWIEANNMTPYILVDAKAEGLIAPTEHAKNNQIIFNIATRATHGLQLGDQWVEFSARFGGISKQVQVPVAGIQAIYANENGRGIVFSNESESSSDTVADESLQQSNSVERKNKQPTLKIVK